MALASLGNAFYYLKQYEEARLAFIRPLNSDDFILYVFHRAVLQQELPEAIKFCDRALEINPTLWFTPAGFYPLQHGRLSGSDH